MKTAIHRLILVATGAALSASALAHPGAHGAEGVLVTVMHLLGEHGYLVLPLLVAVAFAWRRALRD